jgi:hypothetical protein
MKSDPRIKPERDGKRGYRAKRATLVRKQQRAFKQSRREGRS